MKKPILTALALAAAAAVGCASAYGPRYERADSRGDFGYTDVRLDENRYRIEYRADHADSGLAQDFAMRRAAELTLARNYEWFQVINRNRAFSDDFFGRYDTHRYGVADQVADRSYPDNRYPDDRYRDRPAYYDRGYDDQSAAVIEVVMGYDPPPRGSSIYDPRRVLDYATDYRRADNDRYYERGRN